MRYLSMATLVCLSLAAPVGAQAPDPQMMAPIQKFVTSFNNGDMAAAAATHASSADLTIIDEVPPFMWQGAKAFQDWSSALDAVSKQAGITEAKVTLGTATRVESSGDSAYVVLPATYAYKEKGVAMRERSQMTFALKKGANGWLIHGWTWTGPKPQKVAAGGKR